jgi:hypothetical protein
VISWSDQDLAGLAPNQDENIVSDVCEDGIEK